MWRQQDGIIRSLSLELLASEITSNQQLCSSQGQIYSALRVADISGLKASAQGKLEVCHSYKRTSLKRVLLQNMLLRRLILATCSSQAKAFYNIQPLQPKLRQIYDVLCGYNYITCDWVWRTRSCHIGNLDWISKSEGDEVYSAFRYKTPSYCFQHSLIFTSPDCIKTA